MSASTQNQALAALLFLYRDVLRVELPKIGDIVRARRPKRLPVVLTRDEVPAVLVELTSTHALVASLLYGTGARLMEALRLRAKDIDFETRTLVIRRGKGDKDQMTVLPDALIPGLRGHLERVRRMHARDLARGYGGVMLPDALAEKYRNAKRSWSWSWQFGAARGQAGGTARRHRQAG